MISRKLFKKADQTCSLWEVQPLVIYEEFEGWACVQKIDAFQKALYEAGFHLWRKQVEVITLRGFDVDP
jgi:hypothetical protein